MRCLIATLLVLAACMASAAWSYAKFGGWGLVCLFGAFAVVLLLTYKYGLKIAMSSSAAWMRSAGRVLGGARLTVHSIRRGDPPDRGPSLVDILSNEELLAEQNERYEIEMSDLEIHEEPPTFEEWLEDWKRDEARDDGRSDWYDLEITITPAADQSNSEWWPNFLLVTRVGDQAESVHPYEIQRLEAGHIETIERWDDSTSGFLPWSDDEERGCQGAARLRLKVGLRRGLERFALVYHFVPVPGEISVPATDGE